MRILILFFILSFYFEAQSQISWNVDKIALWYDSELEKFGSNRTYNEVWAFVSGDREYGVIGSRAGTYIVDVTYAQNPELVKFIPGAHNDATNRDYYDYNGYLYMVCDQGNSTLQIADLHYLPDSVPIIYDSDELFTRCHNIFIDTTTKHLYACSVSKKDSVVDLEIYDLSNSPIPELLLSYNNEHIEGFHDIFVKNDTAYGNNGKTGLFFYDFSDTSNPKILNSIIDYPDKGYNHAGYALENDEYYYFSDETHGTDIKVVEVDKFNDPQVVGLFNAGENPEEIVVHNLLVRDNLLFVSYYHEGLQIYNLDNPKKPKKVGYYQTYTETHPDGSKDYRGFSGAWGVYPYLPSGYILTSDREKGLFIFSISKIDGKGHPELKPYKTFFPNPFNNYIDLVYPNDVILNIDLYDMNGRLVERNMKFEGQRGVNRIYFREKLPSGIYFLEVETESQTFVEKVMKE